MSISGYILEPIRVGQSNGPFTQTPDIYVANQAAFDAAYPSNESAPRTDYMVCVTSEGTGKPGLLEFARFGYTKNEVVERFAYDSQAGAFKPLRGAAPTEVGSLATDSNEKRLRIRPPVQPLLAAPYRLSVVGSGGEWSIAIVAKDADFGSPTTVPTRSVQVSSETGNLNWRTSDLTTYAGLQVRFQQQQFFLPKDSTGRLGLAPVSVSDPTLMLNPLPGTGQLPRVRFGYGDYLTSVEVTAFSATPTAGTVEWLRATGELKFNPDDAAAKVGIPVYYDGVLFAASLVLPQQTLGVITAPARIQNLPPVGVDLIFTVTGDSGYYRFPTVVYRSAFDATGKKGEVQIKLDAQDTTKADVMFSAADRIKYAGKTITLYLGDLPIERGISVRLLRNPVNLDGTGATKDVTAIYDVKGATWSDPIIASPQVSLPSLPIDAAAYPRKIRVIQGQGSYTSDDFRDLTAPLPPEGLGYYVDFDLGTFFFAQRKVDKLATLGLTPDVVFDPLMIPSNLSLGIQKTLDSTEYTPLVIGRDALVDTASGVVSLTSTNASVISGTVTGSGLQFLNDAKANFILAGVQAGSPVVIGDKVYTVASVSSSTALRLTPDLPSSAAGQRYTVYENREVLADRYFDEVILLDPSTKVERIRALGVASNTIRLNVPKTYVRSSGFRISALQEDAFANVVIVSSDLGFGTPAKGTVQISEATGNLHFAAGDIGLPLYWARTLVPKFDFNLQPELGLVQFSERLLAGEEVRITYTVSPPSTLPPTLPGAPITEYARFLVRKEVTKDHPTPTSTLSFNPDGLRVASTPAPAVFRGGRPQKLGVQCAVDAELSQITFLPDDQKTDALPHGAIVAPNERVYIDYYVTQAVGGEKTFTVLQPPLLTAVVTINEADEYGNPLNSFKVHGDHRLSFPGGALMRIEAEQIYLLGSSSYDASANKTTVTLYNSGAIPAFSQVFLDTFNDPKIYVSSGPTPITSAVQTVAYFVEPAGAYESVPRGSNTFAVPGDQASLYRPSTVVLFTNSAGTFSDFLQVTGSAYDGNTGRTTIALSANAVRQYVYGKQILKRSVRPIYEPPLLEAQTSRIPKLAQPYLVYRQVLDQPGDVLKPQQYTIDETGRIVFTDGLRKSEEFAICYTGLSTDRTGLKLKASYTHQITPSAVNGLLGQTLIADYFVRSPDSFYFRVENMTNFRGEYAAEIASAASSGSSGPQTSNASQPKLWEQGRKSMYFDERHLSNQDLIARSWLLIHNTLINLLEDYRKHSIGWVVGNNDGKLLFDGKVGAVAPPVKNQIDDRIRVSKAPYAISGPPFQVTSIGTYRTYYAASPSSRFYPTARDFFGVAAVASNTAAGDEVLDTKSTNLTGVSNVRARQPWAILTDASTYSGSTTLYVDNANGDLAHLRPAFTSGMFVIVRNQDGAIVSAANTTVTVVSATQLTLSLALTGTAHVGATVYRDPADAALLRHVFGRDYGLNAELGQLTYVAADGGSPANKPLQVNESVSGSLTFSNTETTPYKFPALFGGMEDDDGELSFPIQTPARDSELTYLSTAVRMIAAIRANASDSFEGGTGTVATNTTFTMSGTTPALSVGDLIRITAGANADLTRFRKVTAIAGSTVTVTGPILTAGSFTYEASVSNTVVSGTVPLSPVSTTTVVYTGTSFSGALVGHTLVFLSAGTLFNVRAQITAVSGTSVTVSPALTSAPVSGVQFRVDRPIATYGGAGAGHAVAHLRSALSGLLAVYASEQSTLAGIIGQGQLTADSAQIISTLYAAIPALLSAVQSFEALFTGDYAVYSNTQSLLTNSEFVTGLTVSELDPRALGLTNRITELTDIKQKVTDILASTDQLYDKRYTWIDSRINLESGLLVRQERAVKNRVKAQAEALKQLMKLLAVGGST